MKNIGYSTVLRTIRGTIAAIKKSQLIDLKKSSTYRFKSSSEALRTYY